MSERESEEIEDQVAVLALACRVPGAASVEELWRNLEEGVESISLLSEGELAAAGVPAHHLRDPAYVRAKGVLRGVDLFDAGLFGVTPREAETIDPQHRLLLECAWEALESAGYSQEEQAGPVGVFAGAETSGYQAELAGVEEMLGSGNDFLATRISYKLNLRGPSFTVQTACSTSLVAVHLAMKSLLDGECDLALAGGASLRLPQERGYLYQPGGIYSPDGHCRAFDAEAAGTIRGNGAGLVLLKRLEDALADGDTVRAVLRGSGVNNDGAAKVGFTAPSVDGQARVIAEALALARVAPETIGYVEAHGSGTPVGDPIEVAALTQAFRLGAEHRGTCALGSIKSNLGHLGAAAGVLGLIKAVLAVERGRIPPSLHFRSPNPRIDFAGSPFYVNARLAPWPPRDTPRRAGVSAFGLGGTNCHVIVEEAPAAPPLAAPSPAAAAGAHLLLLSARTESALAAATERLADHLKAHPEADLGDVAYTLQVGRRSFEHRRAVVCADLPDAVLALTGSPRRMPIRRRGAGTPQVAFLFPGQGAQRAGMGRGLYRREEVFRNQVDLGCEILRPRLGFDLREALFPAREDAEANVRLAQTAIAQPALFVLEHALAQLWMSWGVRPTALLGHSLGEYVAACLAGVFPLAAALDLVAARAELMQGLPTGVMLAVLLPEEEVRELLGPALSLAAVNAPGVVVVSGPEEEVAAFEERLATRELPFKRLATSHAAHSAAVEPILAPFAERVRAAAPEPPRIPVVSNLTGTWLTAEEATDPGYWARHLRRTMRFAAGVRQLAEEPGRVYLEVGPGDTLSQLVHDVLCRPAGQVFALPSLPSPQEGRIRDLTLAKAGGAGGDEAALLRAAGGLWQAGVKLDWPALHDGPRRRIALPVYPFERRSYWLHRQPAAAVAPPTPLRTSPSKETPMAEPLRAETADTPRQQQIRAQLQGLFAELFGIPPEEVLPDVTFLELGASSLFLLRASQRIQDRLGVSIPFRRLIEELVTVDDLAAYLAQEQGEAEPTRQAAPLRTPEPTPATSATSPAAPPTGPPTAGPEPSPGLQASLQAIVAEQLRIMERQLDLLARGAISAEPAPAPAAPRLPPLALHPTFAQPPEPASPATSTPGARPYVPYRPIDRMAGDNLSPRQREYLERLVERLAGKTRRSKELIQTYRRALANSRASAGFRLLFKELVYPLVGHRGAGSHLWDVDGNEYVDLTMGFGSLFFGHSPDFLREALEAQLALGVQVGPESETAGRVAALICELTGAERVTFCNSGTEAVMVALRLARAVTGRSRIALFAGSFHGTFDGLLAQGERQADGRLQAVPLSPGIPHSLIQDVLVLDYESVDSLAVVEEHAGELAAVLVEPRQSRRPDLDRSELLNRLRALTERTGIALVFDEVVTGFRAHQGGMQALYGVRADITTYGKAVANGMPIGVVAGKATYLDAIDGGDWRYGDRSLPEAGTTFFGGTFFRHPLVMAAALACLERFRANPGLQEELARRTERLVATLDGLFREEGLAVRMTRFSSFFLFNFSDWTTRDLFFFHLLDRGIYVWESRLCYLSTAHTEEDLERIVEAVRGSLREMREGGFLPAVPAGREAQAPQPLPAAAAYSLPLTEDQRELWELVQLGETASRALNLAQAFYLRGALDRAALERSLQHLVDRHDALRVTFSPNGESQTVAAHREVNLTWTDLRGSGRDVRALLAEEARRPFDLARGPLLRFHGIRLEAELHVLALYVHHLAIDGHSTGILLDELATSYACEVTGEPSPLAAPQPYRHAVEEILVRERGPGMASHEAFWLDRFSPLPPPLALPADRPRPARRTFPGDRRATRLSPEVSSALKKLAARLGCTSSTFLLAAVTALLHRLAGQNDLVVGVPASGHPPDSVALVGYFLHLLPLRFRIAPGSTFADLVLEVRKALLDGHEHGEYPVRRLVRKLGLEQVQSRPPLFAALFNHDTAAGMKMLDLEVESQPISCGAEEFEVFWNVFETERTFDLQCGFNSDLFDGATVERWLGSLRSLLAGVLAEPRQSLADLDLTGEAERRLALTMEGR